MGREVPAPPCAALSRCGINNTWAHGIHHGMYSVTHAMCTGHRPDIQSWASAQRWPDSGQRELLITAGPSTLASQASRGWGCTEGQGSQNRHQPPS